MEFDALVREFGPWIAVVVATLLSVGATLKIAVPRLVDAWIEDRRKQRDTQIELTMGERQEDITLLSQMVNLTNQVVKQNQALTTFITDKLLYRLDTHDKEVKQELHDIEQRWLVASREIAETRGKTQILSIEVAKLVDNYKSLEERVVSLVAFGLEKSSLRKDSKLEKTKD